MDLDNIIQDLVTVCQDKKAEQVTVYHFKHMSQLFDYIIIATASNTVHCKALVESLDKRIKELNAADQNPDLFPIPRLSGKAESGWIVIDLNSIIIQVVTEPVRALYDLDGLYEKRAVTYHY